MHLESVISPGDFNLELIIGHPVRQSGEILIVIHLPDIVKHPTDPIGPQTDCRPTWQASEVGTKLKQAKTGIPADLGGASIKYGASINFLVILASISDFPVPQRRVPSD